MLVLSLAQEFLIAADGGLRDDFKDAPGGDLHSQHSTLNWPFRAVKLRRGDAGAEGLPAVLPAVDLLDGPDKDPFAGRRQAKPGGVEIEDL